MQQRTNAATTCCYCAEIAQRLRTRSPILAAMAIGAISVCLPVIEWQLFSRAQQVRYNRFFLLPLLSVELFLLPLLFEFTHTFGPIEFCLNSLSDLPVRLASFTSLMDPLLSSVLETLQQVSVWLATTATTYRSHWVVCVCLLLLGLSRHFICCLRH